MHVTSDMIEKIKVRIVGSVNATLSSAITFARNFSPHSKRSFFGKKQESKISIFKKT